MEHNEDLHNKIIHALKNTSQPLKVKVSGDSMLPLIKNGDYITVTKNTPLKVGDIILFEYTPGCLLVHRIIKKKHGFIYTKGDHAVAVEKITMDSIIGKVDKVISSGYIFSPDSRIIRLINALLSYLVYRRWKKTGDYRASIDCLYGRINAFILKNMRQINKLYS